jgi:hypothetical protein
MYIYLSKALYSGEVLVLPHPIAHVHVYDEYTYMFVYIYACMYIHLDMCLFIFTDIVCLIITFFLVMNIFF